MDKDDIKLSDLGRIFFGEAPPAYLFEVVVRVFILYLVILVAMRFLGKRMVGKVSRADVAARVSLAAAVGLPIQRPDRGLLAAIVIVILIICISRALGWLTSRYFPFEKKYLGTYILLVTDGVINKQNLNKVRLSKDSLFAALRAENIKHLGQVSRFYMEASGKFSLIKKEKPGAGLSVIPDWDPELQETQEKSGKMLCKDCGYELDKVARTCLNCGGTQSVSGIITNAGR